MDMSINPVYQVLSDDRQASLSSFIAHIKQMTLTHVPLVHDTFPIHINKLAMDFGRVNDFRIQKCNHRTHLTTDGIGD
jgi:hypothetical protein